GARGAGARPVAAEPAAAVTGGVAGGVRNGAAVRRALAVGVEARSSRGALAAHGRRDAVAFPGGELRALRSGRSRGRAGPTAASRRRRVVVTELDGRGGGRGSGGRGRGAGGRVLRRGGRGAADDLLVHRGAEELRGEHGERALETELIPQVDLDRLLGERRYRGARGIAGGAGRLALDLVALEVRQRRGGHRVRRAVAR